ncbi:MAG: sugar transferase [Candidatus Latescibacteria bacterium]|nr:sugar transferase [Candidatus Latescibacterota bacterium]
MNYKKLLSFVVLLLLDVLTIIVSYLAAYFLRTHILSLFFKEVSAALPFQIFISRFYLVIPFILIFGYEGLYHRRFDFWQETRLLWKSNFIATAMIMIILFVTQSFIVSRAIVIIAFVLNLILLPIQRNVIKKILFTVSLWSKNILVIGSTETAERLQQRFAKHDTLGYRVAHHIESDVFKQNRELVYKSLLSRKIDGVIIDSDKVEPKQVLELYENAEGKVQDFFVIPALSQLQTTGVQIEQLEDVLLMKYHYNLLRTESRIVKRIFDLLIAGVAMIVSIPLFLIISLIVKLSDKGSILHIQERLGKNNKLFKCYKFRTMYLDAPTRLENFLKNSPQAKSDWEKYLKITDDPRVFSVGKFLRRSSLDELPQLWNVIKGDMSLVGPRPYLPHEVENLNHKITIITKVLPGITGLWQVSGRSRLTFAERMRLDEYYVKNWSVWLDSVIMFKTAKVLFKTEGAY